MPARNYSGTFVIRIGKDMHEKLSKKAYRENISLNELVKSLLVVGLKNGEKKVEKSLVV